MYIFSMFSPFEHTKMEK